MNNKQLTSYVGIDSCIQSGLSINWSRETPWYYCESCKQSYYTWSGVYKIAYQKTKAVQITEKRSVKDIDDGNIMHTIIKPKIPSNDSFNALPQSTQNTAPSNDKANSSILDDISLIGLDKAEIVDRYTYQQRPNSYGWWFSFELSRQRGRWQTASLQW